MHSDIRGLTLTTDSADAVEGFNETMRQYMEYRAGAGEAIKQMLGADPDFVMGNCFKGYLFNLFATSAMRPKIEESLAAAEAGVSKVTAREAAHVDALRAWTKGDVGNACKIWDAILLDHPHDLLALRLQHYNSFWMGHTQDIRDSIARVIDQWDDSVPGYSSVQGMYAFGLEECGEYARAEEFGRQAVESNPDDLWAIHAVAHTLEMQGRLREGMEWLNYPADAWDDRNPFRGHLWWHLTMYSVEAGDYDTVLELFDRSVQPPVWDFYLDVQNGASMLLRLDLLGVDVGDRWKAMADAMERHVDDHVLAFTDTHAMMALAADKRFDAAEKLLASLHEFGDTPENFAATTMESTTIPVCQALLDFAKNDYGAVVDTLLPLRYDLACIGGSHAQRDVFHQLLIEATIRDKQFTLARALLSERLAQKPNSHGSWLKYAETLAALGDTQRATAARERADAVLSS
tara:strand:- start:3569 stop:4951 length:1383 start_codon:yes stop_codon:yes gene_type:complete